jgi:hypothetical protein
LGWFKEVNWIIQLPDVPGVKQPAVEVAVLPVAFPVFFFPEYKLVIFYEYQTHEVFFADLRHSFPKTFSLFYTPVVITGNETIHFYLGIIKI